MAIIPLPPNGDTTWDDWATFVHNAAAAVDAGETISTTESWDTSRAYRGALAAFQLTPA